MSQRLILVVDNHPITLRFMRLLLEGEGYQVVTADDGLSAIEILSGCVPDVVFIDLVMPNISGDKLCRIIRSMPNMSDTRIIILSAIATEDGIDFVDMGADACIAKGPMDLMSEHVLSVLASLEIDSEPGEVVETLGGESLHRRAITQELLSSKRHFEAILSNLSEGIIELTDDGRVVYANQAAISLLGPEEELLAASFFDLVGQEHRRTAEELFRQCQDGIRATTRARELLMLGGRRCALRMVRGEEEGSSFVLVILNDVTDQKKMEKRLKQAERMEAVGVLAGGVAHDLNNILSSIVSYPELLLLELPPDSPLGRSILTIQRAGEKATGIVRDLLTLARRGAGSEVVILNRVITEYLDSPEMKSLCTTHTNASVKSELAGDLLPVLGSPVHLSQMVMNLVANAAEASRNGNEILITTKNCHIERQPEEQGIDILDAGPGDYVMLRVTDSGAGMSVEDIERVFEPFYTKKVMGRSGTGLGMAVVWRVVRDHHGYIDIKSEPLVGTSVTVYLPVTRKEAEEGGQDAAIEQLHGAGESILVVDDVQEQRDLACAMLRRLGYQPQAVAGGEEAVAFLQQQPVDLVLLDMIMDPGIDGLETFRRIRRLNPEQKAVIVSGFSESEETKEAQRLGAGSFVSKPYLLAKIATAVAAELQVPAGADPPAADDAQEGDRT